MNKLDYVVGEGKTTSIPILFHCWSNLTSLLLLLPLLSNYYFTDWSITVSSRTMEVVIGSLRWIVRVHYVTTSTTCHGSCRTFQENYDTYRYDSRSNWLFPYNGYRRFVCNGICCLDDNSWLWNFFGKCLFRCPYMVKKKNQHKIILLLLCRLERQKSWCAQEE